MFSILHVHPYLCLIVIVELYRWRLLFKRSGYQEVLTVDHHGFPVLMRATIYPRTAPIEISVLHKIGNLVKRHLCTEEDNLMESK